MRSLSAIPDPRGLVGLNHLSIQPAAGESSTGLIVERGRAARCQVMPLGPVRRRLPTRDACGALGMTRDNMGRRGYWGLEQRIHLWQVSRRAHQRARGGAGA